MQFSARIDRLLEDPSLSESDKESLLNLEDRIRRAERSLLKEAKILDEQERLVKFGKPKLVTKA